MLNVDASTRPARGSLCPLVLIMLNVDASTRPARGGLCPLIVIMLNLDGIPVLHVVASILLL